MSSTIFGLRSSYMLEYHWLFTLFLRSARHFTGAEGKWTPLPPISQPSSPRSFPFFFFFKFLFLLLWLGEFHCFVFQFRIFFSVSTSLLLNPYSVFFSSVIIFLSSDFCQSLSYIFCLFIDVFTVTMHSSLEFGEHLYDRYFEPFIR